MTPELLTPQKKRLHLAEQEAQLVDNMIKDSLQSPRKQLLARDIDELMRIKEINQAEDRRLRALHISVAFACSLLLTITAFEWKTYDEKEQINLSYNAEKFEELTEIPLTEQPPPPPPSSTVQVLFNEVPDEEIIEEIEVDLDVEITSDMSVSDEIFNPFELDEPEDEEADVVFTIVEEQPTPIGGFEAFYSSISENLKYPDPARRVGIEGKVFLQFVVSPGGDVTNVTTAKGIGYGCDEAAMKALEFTPKWNPGKQRGRPVNVRVIVPIVFKLAK